MFWGDPNLLLHHVSNRLYCGNLRSLVNDGVLTIPNNGTTLVKATSFYDNEMGFSHRMAELAIILSGK